MFRALVFLALCGLVLGEGYWDIQLSPQSIASVPYGPSHISIWQHANDRERFYAMPLVHLLKDSARVTSNILTEITEMSFDVLLWSEEAKEAVYLYLKREYNASISQSQIEMLPMEKIRITWKDNLRPISSRFRIIDNWKSNTHLPPVVTFQFTCTSRPVCEELMTAIKESPHFFNSLEMEYVINGQRSARRSLSVTGRHIVQGRLWTKLRTMTGAGEARYLKADDLKTLTSESVSTVLTSLTTDSDYVDTGDEVRVNDVLQHVLTRQQVSTNDFRPEQWRSVFWNPTWARPDKLTHFLNQALARDASDTQSFLLNEQARSQSAEGGSGASFLDLFSVEANGATSSNSQTKVQRQDVLSALRERHSNVEWTGEQFRVKPMKLYRLNLSTLNTSDNVATANVQVRRYESVHSIQLRVADSDSTPQSPSLTPQLVESRLLQKLNETKTNITEQTDNKLKTQGTVLMNTITARSNEARARLFPIQRKLATLPGWPAGEYCVLKRSDTCPHGFTHHYAWVQFPATSTYVGHFGTSYIKDLSDGRADVTSPGTRPRIARLRVTSQTSRAIQVIVERSGAVPDKDVTVYVCCH